MKIAIDDFILAEQSGPVGVRDFAVNTQRAVDAVRYLRAPAEAFFDRENQSTIITFTVTRLHTSLSAAEVFLLEHETAVPPTGLVVFTAQGDDGQEVSRYLADAVVEVSEATYIGLSTRHQYTIKGGLLLTQNPS